MCPNNGMVFFMCAQLLMQATAHWGSVQTLYKSALKADSGKKTCGSIVPGFLVGHSTNWALPAPYKLFWWTCSWYYSNHMNAEWNQIPIKTSCFCGEFCSHSVTHDTLVSPGGWVGCPSNTLVSLVLMLGSGNSGNRPYELLSPASWLNSCWNRNSNTLG